MRSIILVFMVFLFVISCNQQEEYITSAETNVVENTMLTLSKPPAQSGPYVMRTESTIFGLILVAGDERTGLTAFVGGDLEGACVGEPNSFDVIPLLEIDVPEDVNRIINLQKGEVRTSVYEGVYTGGSFCAFAFNHQMVASGTSNLVLTDNDLYTFLTDDNKNANAFGWNATGKLTTPGGDTVGFTGISRIVWDGVDDNSLKINDKVRLN